MWTLFREYLPVVVKHWWASVPGICGGLLGLATAFFPSVEVPPAIWVSLTVGGLTIAQFLAYRDVRAKLDESEGSESERRDARAVKEGLGQLLSEGEAMRRKILKDAGMRLAPVSKIVSGLALPTFESAAKWVKPHREWCSRTESYLAENLGGYYVDRFWSPTGIEHPNADSYGFVSSDHIPYLNGMYCRLIRLNQFLAELG